MSRFSLTAFFACAALLAASVLFFYPKWKMPGTEATLSWDVSGYYLYLPAALIHQDMKQLSWWGAVEERYNPGPGMGQAFQHPSGNYVMKYPMGQALQFLPWFTLAHVFAPLFGYPDDGFSAPYQAAVSWGSLIVALIGLWFLRRVLLVYFSDKTTAAALLCLVFGTNYFEYAGVTGAMTHNWLFTLNTLLIFSTIRFYERPTLAWAAAIGLLTGWAALTRPTEIISALIPLFWAVGSWRALRERFGFFRQHFFKITLAGVIAGAVMFLQAAYWKYATGEWIVYSYQEQGFSWLHPHLSDVLFSARAGWLVYSPMMAFGILGMFWLAARPAATPAAAEKKSVKALLPVLLIYCLLSLYITSAWDIWWYGGSLGQRALVQAYPLWTFPLAALIAWVSERGWRRMVFVPLAAICIYLNLWWSYQAHGGGLFVSEQMTRAYMLKVLGRFELDRDWLKLLDTKEEFKGAERRNVREVYANGFETDTVAVTRDKPLMGQQSLMLSKETQFSPIYEVYKSAANPEATPSWARCSVTFQCDPKEWNWWQMTQFIVRFKDGDRIPKQNTIRLQRHVDGSEIKMLYFDVRLPKARFDKMEVLFWNADGGQRIRIDDLKVELFD